MVVEETLEKENADIGSQYDTTFKVEVGMEHDYGIGEKEQACMNENEDEARTDDGGVNDSLIQALNLNPNEGLFLENFSTAWAQGNEELIDIASDRVYNTLLY